MNIIHIRNVISDAYKIQFIGSNIIRLLYSYVHFNKIKNINKCINKKLKNNGKYHMNYQKRKDNMFYNSYSLHIAEKIYQEYNIYNTNQIKRKIHYLLNK